MAIQYLNAKRIRGNTTKGEWGIVGTTYTPNTTNARFDFTDPVGGSATTQTASYDTGSVQGNTWTIRCKVHYTTLSAGDGEIDIGLSDTNQTAGGNGNQDFIGVRLIPSALSGSNGLFRPRQTTNDEPRQGADSSNYISQAVDTDYYLQIQRTSSTQYNVKWGTNSGYTGDIANYTNGSGTNNIDSGITGLQFIKIMNAETETSGSTIGYIKDLKFWNSSDTSGTPTKSFSFEDDKASLITTPSSNAWKFNGGKVTLSHQFLPAGTSNNWSLAMWLKFDNFTDSDELVREHTSNMELWRNSNGLYVTAGSSNPQIVDDDDLAINTWYHLVLTNNGGTFKAYWNGSEVSLSDTSTKTISSVTAWTIGNRGDSTTTEAFHGLFDQMLVYDDVLTSGEVSTLYGGGDGVKVPSTSNLITHYDFEQTGTTLEDQVGNNDGTAGTHQGSGTVTTGQTGKFPAGTDLTENTIFEETDTYKTYWLQSNVWQDQLGTPTWSSDFTSASGWTSSDSRMSIGTGNNRLDFDVRRDTTESTIYRDFGAGNISNTDWRLRFKLVITDLVGGSSSEKSWIFGFSNLTTQSITTNCNAMGFGHRSSSNSSERDILIHACDNDNPKDGSNLQEIGTNLLVDDTTYYYELRRIDTTTLRVTLYTDSNYSTAVSGFPIDRTVVAGDGEDMQYFRAVNTTYSSTIAGQITGYIQDMKFWNGAT